MTKAELVEKVANQINLTKNRPKLSLILFFQVLPIHWLKEKKSN